MNKFVFYPSDDKLDGVIKYFSRYGKPYVFFEASSVYAPYFVTEIIKEDPNAVWCSDESEGLKAILTIGIPNYYIKLTHYSFRSHKSDNLYVRSWNLSGSKDGYNYKIIDSKPINDDLKNNQIGHYQVSTGIYKYFKLIQTSTNIRGDKNMRVTGFEIFGTLITHLGNCITNVNNQIIFRKHIFISFFSFMK